MANRSYKDLQKVSEKLQDIFKKEEKSAVVPIFKKSLIFGQSTAIQDSNGIYSYLQIYAGSQKLASQLSNICGSAASKQVSVICPNDITAVISLWACWISGQVAVPLSNRYPCSVLKYIINDSQSKVLITTPEFENLMRSFIEHTEIAILVVDHSFLPKENLLNLLSKSYIELNNKVIVFGTLSNDFYKESNALIAYTSEKHIKPTGTVWTHKSMNEHIKYLSYECKFHSSDCFLNLMPQNSICGIVFLMCALCNGGKVIMQDYFNSANIWNVLLNLNESEEVCINAFTAASNTYAMLIEEFNHTGRQNNKWLQYVREHCNENIRLMISGLLPLYSNTFYMWRHITGHHFLVYNKRTAKNGMDCRGPFAQYYNDKYILGNIRDLQTEIKNT